MPVIPPASHSDADAVAHFTPGVAVDVRLTLRPLQRGVGDPCVRVTSEGVWLTRRDDAAGQFAPASLLVRAPDSPVRPGVIEARAWGPGAAAAVAEVPHLLGLDDAGWPAFDALLESTAGQLPSHVLEARRRRPGLRLAAHGRLAQQLMTVTLEQKVTHDQARHGWRWLVRATSEPAPGPVPARMLLPPDPARVLRVPSWQWHAGWVQPSQAKAVLRVAERAGSLDRVGRAAQPADVAAAVRLSEQVRSLPGIGVWTAAEALQRSHAAADLVAVGDYHLAQFVGQVLTGRRTDDDGMLRLLQPWEGHRQRVVRMIGLSGERKQAFGPKLTPADHRGY
ncbi:MAG: 3-methyladenine DNA glycosylase [Micrococcus sp.]|nr:3-methyladenine DNA glycosylase [Micrococcus sp.]